MSDVKIIRRNLHQLRLVVLTWAKKIIIVFYLHLVHVNYKLKDGGL